jgi:hypothetical protein
VQGAHTCLQLRIQVTREPVPGSNAERAKSQIVICNVFFQPVICRGVRIVPELVG